MEITLDSSNPDSKHIIRVHNILNEPETRPAPALETLRSVLEEGKSHPDDENGNYIQDIAIRDFNIHHPHLGGRDIGADNRSEQLLELVDQVSLQQHVPVGSHTYQSDIHDTYQVLDLCFTTEDLCDRLTKCVGRRDLDHESDHYPMTITLNIAIADAQQRRPYKWKNANHDKITERFRELTQDLQ